MAKDWRKANVSPNINKSKKKDPGNYRVISLVLILEKMMKQLILENISRNKKIIRSCQHGFPKRVMLDPLDKQL